MGPLIRGLWAGDVMFTVNDTNNAYMAGGLGLYTAVETQSRFANLSLQFDQSKGPGCGCRIPEARFYIAGYGPWQLAECHECTAGRVWNTTSERCIDCQPGTFKNASLVCQSCPMGRTSTAASSQCSPCVQDAMPLGERFRVVVIVDLPCGGVDGCRHAVCGQANDRSGFDQH
jgi:hypothetical protein